MRGLKYYICKYVGHHSYEYGRVVTIGDIGSIIIDVAERLVIAFFIGLLAYAVYLHAES